MPKQTDMTEGRPLGLLIGFALPLSASSALQLLYNLADAAVVGRLIGVSAFAAVGAAGFFYWMLFSTMLGLTHGFGTIMAQRFGARDGEGLRRAFASALLLSLGLGALFSLVSMALTAPLLRLLRTPAEILPDTAAYLRVMLGGLSVTFAYNLLGAAFRAVGDSRTPLAALILACTLNIALDVLLVRATALGVTAVALSTVLAQCVACGWCAVKLRRIEALRLGRADIRLDRAATRALLRLGAPMGARNCVISLGGLAIQFAVNGYGTVVIAGVAAAKRLYGLIEIFGGGFEGAIATFTAQNYGAQKAARIREGVRQARDLLLLGACIAIALLIPLGRSVLSLFIDPADPHAAAVLDAATGQLYAMLALLPGLYLLLMYRAALQGIGNAWAPMASGFVELGMRLLAVLLLPPLLGVPGAYLAEAAGWPVAAALVMLVFHRLARKDFALEKTTGI